MVVDGVRGTGGSTMAVTCGVAHLPYTGKRIAAGQRVACVSEDRLHQKAHACWPLSSHLTVMPGDDTDRVIRWSTAAAVVGVAAVAAVASHEHAYDLVRAHREAG